MDTKPYEIIRNFVHEYGMEVLLNEVASQVESEIDRRKKEGKGVLTLTRIFQDIDRAELMYRSVVAESKDHQAQTVATPKQAPAGPEAR